MRIIRLMAAASLLAATMAPVTQAGAQSSSNGGANAEVLAFCHDFIANEYPDLPLGRCMSWWNSSDQGFITKYCDFLQGQGLLEQEGFDSYSDCVRNPPWDS